MRKVYFYRWLGPIFFLCFTGCPFWGPSSYIPLKTPKGTLAQLAHKMDVPWKGKKDFYYQRFSPYMTSRQRREYLNLSNNKKWDQFHEDFLLFQQLEALLKSSGLELSPLQWTRYYRSSSLKEGLVFLQKLKKKFTTPYSLPKLRCRVERKK